MIKYENSSKHNFTIIDFTIGKKNSGWNNQSYSQVKI